MIIKKIKKLVSRIILEIQFGVCFDEMIVRHRLVEGDKCPGILTTGSYSVLCQDCLSCPYLRDNNKKRESN